MSKKKAPAGFRYTTFGVLVRADKPAGLLAEIPDDPLFAQPRLQKLLGKPKPVRESDIEQYLHNRVKALGGDYRRFAYLGRRGATDDLILLPGRHMVIECKRPGEEPEAHQAREHARLRWAGFEVHVVSTLAEVDAILPPPKGKP